MKTFKTHSIFRIANTWLLCAVFVFLIANRAVFVHSHQTANGVVFTHAHPFHKSAESSSGKKHSHSNAEFAFLEHIEILLLLSFVVFAFFAVAKRGVFENRLSPQYISAYQSGKRGRSPPVQNQ